MIICMPIKFVDCWRAKPISTTICYVVKNDLVQDTMLTLHPHQNQLLLPRYTSTPQAYHLDKNPAL
jgi:hypothetical protein